MERVVQPVSMHWPVSHHTCFVDKTCIFLNRVRIPSFPNTCIVLHHCLLIQVDHFCAHEHTLFGVYILHISAVVMGKESPLHHELKRNCNINGGHEHAGGRKNRLVGEKNDYEWKKFTSWGESWRNFHLFPLFLYVFSDLRWVHSIWSASKAAVFKVLWLLTKIAANWSHSQYLTTIYFFPRDSPVLTTLLLCHNSLTSRRHLRKIRSLKNQYVLLWWGAVYTQHIPCQSSH